MTDRSAARARGRQVAEDRLARATSLLQTVTPAERAAIEETAYAIAAKVIDCILDEAARCAPLAATLAADLPAGSSLRKARECRELALVTRLKAVVAGTDALSR